MKLGKILSSKNQNLALIIGNGINRYNSVEEGRSWSDLLNTLQISRGSKNADVPKLLSLTEFYDLLDLQQKIVSSSEESLQRAFSNLLQEWQPGEHHQKIVEFCPAPYLCTSLI